MKLTLDKNLLLYMVIMGVIAFALTIASADTPSTREGGIVVSNPTKQGSFFIASISEKQVNQVISPIQTADFAFNAIVANWKLDETHALSPASDGAGSPPQAGGEGSKTTTTTEYFDLSLRFLNESWSEWVPVQEEVDFKDNSVIKNQSRLIPVKPTDTFQYKITVKNPEDLKVLKSLSFNYIDSTDGPNNFFSIAAFSAGEKTLNIISRKQWGADESYRFDENGEEIWAPEYYTPKKFVIHHTAGKDANKNPAATVRSIYYWHAKGRGWGDIGYNYLIDSKGNIYEGRKGGDGVVGGHAYQRNRNTIGIAILGCFQSADDTACNTPDKLTPQTQASLNKLIAVKSQAFGIVPDGISPFHGKYLANVIGHKDVGATSCPGDLIYAQLGAIQNESKVQLAALPEMERGEYGARFVRISADSVSIPANRTKNVFVEFKNIGTTVWRGYEDDHVMIAPSDIKNKLAALSQGYTLAFASLSNSFNQPTFKLVDGNVAPGEIGRFIMTLSPNQNKKNETREYTLAWDKRGYFDDADFNLNITTLPPIPEEIDENGNSIEVAALSYSSHTIPAEMATNTSYPVTVAYINVGNKSLYKNDMRLKILYGDTDISPFRNPSWYSEWAMIPPSEEIITPGQTATFKFNLVAPYISALFPHTFELYYNDQLLDSFTNVLNVVDAYEATLMDYSLPIAMLDTWRTDVRLSIKNTGSKTWNGFKVKTGSPGYKYNRFIDSSWLNRNTIIISKEVVEPGDTVDLVFKIDPAYLNGTYRHFYQLVTADGEIISIDGKDAREFITRVDPVR